MDLTGYVSQDMQIPYVTFQPVVLTSNDHVVVGGPARGIFVTGTGNVVFTTWHDDQEVTLPVAVPAGDVVELRGILVKSIKDTSTATIPYVGM